MPHVSQQAIVPMERGAPTVRVVAYVRMSTEHQQYSIHNQMAAIREYAEAHNLSIVRTYADKGISGLQAENRPALKELLATVIRGDSGISNILVYDVSRWGRFQDTDQSAFYEYLCRMHGIDVVYCAEPFANDHTPLSAVLKSVKRVMAAEYSRELSVKVSRALRNIAQRGFDQGGGIIYGLKHVVVDANGKKVNARRARSSVRLRKHHAKLAPGPKHEVRLVRRIFRRYVDLGETTYEIAAYLNAHDYRTRRDNPWRAVQIAYMLTNEKYIGTQTFNLTTGKLRAKRRKAEQSDWIRVPNAFEGIVSPELFRRAQARYAERRRVLTDGELLDRLRRFLAKHGEITYNLMKRHGLSPCVYQSRFGTLTNAYQLIGYKGRPWYMHWITRFERSRMRKRIFEEMRIHLERDGETMSANPIHSRFWISNRLRCALYLVRRRKTDLWRTRLKLGPGVTLYILGRLDADDHTILDFYVIPTAARRMMQKTFRLNAGTEVERFRVADIATVCWVLSKHRALALPAPLNLQRSVRRQERH
jgi:DNA invertase Pin-like site-specific DNA recombinase